MINVPMDVNVQVDTIATWKSWSAEVKRTRAAALRALRVYERELENLHSLMKRGNALDYAVHVQCQRLNKAIVSTERATANHREAVDHYNHWTDRVTVETGCAKRKEGDEA